tara:strand:- start:2099 stop:2524 length:426 start_codon:yes stop_codon:yes gene_type:complete
MDVFWGSSILVEPSYINRLIITTTTTLLASQLNFSNGTVFQYLIAGGGTSTSGGKVHLGSAVVTNNTVDLVCTVGAYNGISTISGLGLTTISSEETWIPRGAGVYPGIYGIGSGSTSGVIDGANTGKQGNSANTGVIILFY